MIMKLESGVKKRAYKHTELLSFVYGENVVCGTSFDFLSLSLSESNKINASIICNLF